jgi:hypothetical protein
MLAIVVVEKQKERERESLFLGASFECGDVGVEAALHAVRLQKTGH